MALVSASKYRLGSLVLPAMIFLIRRSCALGLESSKWPDWTYFFQDALSSTSGGVSIFTDFCECDCTRKFAREDDMRLVFFFERLFATWCVVVVG